MAYKIIYGTDTESIEDYGQCVVLLIPDEVDDIEEYLSEHHYDDIPQEHIVTMEDIISSLSLILATSRLHPQTQSEIIASLVDAVDNND